MRVRRLCALVLTAMLVSATTSLAGDYTPSFAIPSPAAPAQVQPSAPTREHQRNGASDRRMLAWVLLLIKDGKGAR
jgi:hypothetical protein